MSDKPLPHDFDDELFSAYLDDELSAEDRAAVEARIAADPAARQLLEQLRSVSQSVHSLPQQAVGHDLRESILRRAEHAKSAAKANSTNGAPAGLGDAMPKFTIGRTARGWVWASLAVAAALMIMVFQPDAPDDGKLPAVAQRNNEVPAFTAAPETAAPPAMSLSTARELADVEDGVETSAAGKPSIAANRPAMDQLGAASESDVKTSDDADAFGGVSLSREPARAVDEEELVVVHVRAKRAAIENKTFDQLLAKNGIVVDTATSSDDRVDANAERLREQAATGRFAVPAIEQPAGDKSEVDVVLVEAPPTAILSCMSDLNRDLDNYLSVSVEESQPGDEVSTLEAAAPMKKLAFDLGKYSRGVVPQQQKDSFARDKAFYYEPEARRFGGGIGGRLGAASGAEQEESLNRGGYENSGRAQRVLTRGIEFYQSSERSGRGEAVASGQAASEELKQRDLQGALKSPARAEDGRWQVLFVLSPDDAPASPAAGSRAE